MINKILCSIAKIQARYPVLMLIFILLISSYIVFGLIDLDIESDFSEMQPRHLDAYQITDEIDEVFGGETAVIMLLEIDEDNDEIFIDDLKNPEIINFLEELEKSLLDDVDVSSVTSLGSLVPEEYRESEETVSQFIRNNPQTQELYNDDFTKTMVSMTTTVGLGYEEVAPFEDMVYQKVDAIGLPGGTQITATGEPPLGRIIYELIISDAFYTLSIAAIGIFALLLALERSFRSAILIFVPLVFGVSWTGGTLGHLGIELSMATIGVGAIVLGLGVEYGTFMYHRFKEERERGKNQEEATKVAVTGIGKAILTSGTTTIAGFLALSFSISPVMQDLGQSLAAGIFFSLMAAILVAPLLIILNERFEIAILHREEEALNKKKKIYSK